MAEKETELTFGALSNMKKSEFIKLFKKPAPWKKAEAVLFLAKYKFSNGKVALVAVPFKKYTEAAKCFKNEVKKDSGYTAKLTLLASLDKKKVDGNLTFTAIPREGAMNPDYLDTYGKELFGTLKTGFSVVSSDGKMDEKDLKEVVEAAGEELSDKKIKSIVAKEERRGKALNKISENLGQFEKIIGKVKPIELNEKLTLYKEVLSGLTKEADGDDLDDLKKTSERIEIMKKLIEDVEKSTEIAESIKKVLNKLNQL